MVSSFAIVRILGYILTFYILLLAAVPCCIIDECPDDKTEQTNQHDTSDGDCGNCSPFFSCESCAAATVVYEPFNFELMALSDKPAFITYLQPFIPPTLFDFWQPPKLG